MSSTFTTAPLAALSMAIAVAAPAQARSALESLQLRVGPRINATIRTAEVHLSCSDDADCRFDVPANSGFDIVARGAPGQAFHWSGCSAQPAANRCRVEMRGEPVLITVR
ncbi:MAG TPA: hypothetical protein VFP57_04665 [Sphingomicrobium sp.]|jgi:hypothetical protein|nr:hypothetical protein [Sphingomicrobium sp.]